MATNVFKPELWSKLLLRDIMNYGVMLDCVNRNYEGEIKNQGDTVHIQKIGDITINTHDESKAMTHQNIAGTTQVLKIDQAKDFMFLVSDIDKVQANVELMTKYTNKAKKNVVNVKDAYLHALGIAAATNDLGTKAVTPENIYGTLVDMFAELARANAIGADGKGEDGKRPYIVLPPEVVAVIKKSPEASHATTLGDDTVRKGAIMQYAGFDIKQSTNVGADGTFNILAGTTEGITYAEQITKVESLKDKDYFGDFVRGLYLYGGLAAQPECLVKAVFTVA
ncbi:MAG: hypothetical protein II340_06155 [Succinivibrio sp.]|nr:hypothetical protein [Succinivibrio sp.]